MADILRSIHNPISKSIFIFIHSFFACYVMSLHGMECLQNHYTALIMAAVKGHTRIATLLLDRGADMNAGQEVGTFAYSHC